MGRNNGRQKHGFLFGPGRHVPAGCVGCRRPIAWGERCESCKQELRQRKRRKPR